MSGHPKLFQKEFSDYERVKELNVLEYVKKLLQKYGLQELNN